MWSPWGRTPPSAGACNQRHEKMRLSWMLRDIDRSHCNQLSRLFIVVVVVVSVTIVEESMKNAMPGTRDGSRMNGVNQLNGKSILKVFRKKK